MPKKRTGRQREAQRRTRAAEQRLARDEREREKQVRIVAGRTGDPGYLQRVKLPEGGWTLNWSPETPEGRMLQEALQANLRAFREKFGREPRPEDPVVFDPDADEPTPLSPDRWQAELETLRQAVADAGVDPAYISAWQEVGYIVTDQNRHMFSAAEVQAYLDAVERHQQSPLPDRSLPADLFAVELTVRHRRAWSVEPGEEPETWHISADAYDDDGSQVVSHVGDLRFIAVDLYEAGNAYRLLSDEGARASKIAKVLFDHRSGKLIDDLEDSLEPLGERILIIDEVRLEPEWRGFDIGALLIASAIKTLSGGVRAVICYPEPTDGSGTRGPDRGQSTRPKEAVQALGRVCARIGFEHFRDGVWMVDLNLVTFEEAFAQLRAEAQRYDRA